MKSSQKSEKTDSEAEHEFTNIIGGHGRYQIVIFIFFFICTAAYCFHNLIITFFAPNIDHWCARPQEVLQANISIEEWKNFSLPLVKSRTGAYEHSQCNMYNVSVRDGTLYRQSDVLLKCKTWEYDHSIYEGTLVDEWNLVCDREWMVSICNTVFMIAYLLSSVTGGQLSDRFGRRKVMIVSLLLFLTSAFLTLLATDITMFIIFRFLMSLGVSSIYVVSLVIISEIVSVEYRSIYCFMYKYGWSVAYILLPYFAWLMPNWFWLQLTITAPWLILLSVFWIVPETPRWLLAKGKFTELEKFLLYAAEKNKKDMNRVKVEIEDFIAYHSKIEYKERKESVLDFLKTPGMRRNAIIIYCCWFFTSYIYYALTWNMNDLGGNLYWNFFLSGLVEFPEGIISVYVCKYIGHRYGILLGNVMAGTCLAAMAFVPFETKEFLGGKDCKNDEDLKETVTSWLQPWLAVDEYDNGIEKLVSRVIKERLVFMLAGSLTVYGSTITKTSQLRIDKAEDIVWLTITLSMAGRFFSAASFDTLYIYTAEIFPTVVRNVAVGSGSFWARIGALLSPFIHQIEDITYPWVPLAVPGVMCVCFGLLLILLPDTKGETLPDTLEEGERFAKKEKIRPVTEKLTETQHYGT